MPPVPSTIERIRRPLLRAATYVAASLWATGALAAGPPYAARSLDEVLREPGTQGLRLVYSSETAPGSLRVGREPDGTTPLAILDEILAEHGLRAERVGADTYAIVRETGRPAAAAVAQGPPPLTGPRI